MVEIGGHDIVSTSPRHRRSDRAKDGMYRAQRRHHHPVGSAEKLEDRRYSALDRGAGLH